MNNKDASVIKRSPNTFPVFLPAGDQAIVIELGQAINPDTNRKVHNLMQSIESNKIVGVIDLLPSYKSLLVQYDPELVSYSDLQKQLSETELNSDIDTQSKTRIVHIPTLYQGKYAPDLDFVAKHTALTKDEVINTHSNTIYRVYMMGFTPGFPYLGGLSEKLNTPRLSTPRLKIPAGSVGIAESQTGIYPSNTPGGWRLIGSTPVKLFDERRSAPSLLTAGDTIKFVPLPDEETYMQIHKLVESNEYQVTIEGT